jgi:predicted flap endonuclease-1-like 5' DNA nuclease
MSEQSVATAEPVATAETLAVFVLDKGDAAERLLEAIRKVDEIDDNVRIVDAAIANRSKRRGSVKIHQTTDKGALKGGFKGGAIGVVVGALVLGPAGAVVAGAGGALLNSVRNRLHDIGIDDKFMKQVSKEIEKGKSALFVQYEGNWAASIGLVQGAIQAENALLIESTLPAETAAALRALVEPAAESLGGEEVVADYEIVTDEGPEEEAPAAAEEAPAAAEAAPVAAVAAASGNGAHHDDLTQLVGIGPKAAAALVAAGIDSYASLAEANEPQLRKALHAGDMTPPGNVNTWPMQASFAVKGDWQGLMKHNERATAKAKPAAAQHASTAASAPSDDLTQINGIGPRISSILNDGGITSYSQLEHANSGDLRQIIAVGGALPPSSLDSWPTQASYASRGDWAGLASYNGRRR